LWNLLACVVSRGEVNKELRWGDRPPKDVRGAECFAEDENLEPSSPTRNSIHLKQRFPGFNGPNMSNKAGSGTSAVNMDKKVTANTTLPSFRKKVRVQPSKKIEQPIVVTALPNAAPPMDFRA